MRSPLPPQRAPNDATRLEDVYKPQTREERVGLANAYAMRDVRRGIRRVVGKVNQIVAAREAARRRFGPRR